MAKPTFILDTSNTEHRFTVTGDLSVQHAHDLKSFLIQAMELTSNVNLAFDYVTAIDTASIQIIYAIKKEIEKSERKVTLSWPQNENVLDLLTKTGITKIL